MQGCPRRITDTRLLSAHDSVYRTYGMHNIDFINKDECVLLSTQTSIVMCAFKKNANDVLLTNEPSVEGHG